MIILAIETSGSTGGFALVRDGRPVAETVCDITGSHVEKGVHMVDGILQKASVGIGEVDSVAVSLGPGSFTGLRAGMALAKGICMGRGIPLVGVPTLDCVAHAVRCWRGLVAPVLDARRGEVYFSAYRSTQGTLERLTDYLALAPCDVIKMVKDLADDGKILLTGNGLLRHGSELIAGIRSGVTSAPENLWTARPSIVGQLAMDLFRLGKCSDYEMVEPMYVRPSEAERSARNKRDKLA
jgi:tRNA threonylcarbamoyladenosine biosynthesis protein TsaB